MILRMSLKRLGRGMSAIVEKNFVSFWGHFVDILFVMVVVVHIVIMFVHYI